MPAAVLKLAYRRPLYAISPGIHKTMHVLTACVSQLARGYFKVMQYAHLQYQ